MNRTVLSEVHGWTPLIDHLTQTYDLITSAVFGRVWRYCQGDSRVCTASLETIGAELHIDRGTVKRKVKLLVKEGFLKDLTPNLRNRPHLYADTGRAAMQSTIFVTVAENNVTGAENTTTPKSDIKTVAQNTTAVAQNNSGGAQNNSGGAQSRMKKESKKESKKEFNTQSKTESEERGDFSAESLVDPPPSAPAQDSDRRAFDQSVDLTLSGLSPGPKILFSRYLRQLKFLTRDNNRIFVEVPDRDTCEWVNSRAGRMIERNLVGLLNISDPQVHVLVKGSPPI